MQQASKLTQIEFEFKQQGCLLRFCSNMLPKGYFLPEKCLQSNYISFFYHLKFSTILNKSQIKKTIVLKIYSFNFLFK